MSHPWPGHTYEEDQEAWDKKMDSKRLQNAIANLGDQYDRAQAVLDHAEKELRKIGNEIRISAELLPKRVSDALKGESL